MHVTPLTFSLGVIVLLFHINTCTAMTTTSNPTPLTMSPAELPLCNVTNPCLNGGTCREPEDWECSTDPGMGDTVCDCPNNYFGTRCEKSTLPRCGSQTCNANQTCVLRNTNHTCVDSKDMRNLTAPHCQTGVHPLTYSFQKRDQPAVCLDMYYTNLNSLCFDIDSSIEFSIGNQDVTDFFCLEIDYPKWQTCLGVNKTFNRSNFPGGAFHNVTLIVEENDKFPRSANITFSVTFNTAPSVRKNTRSYVLNRAEEGNEFTIDVRQDFGVSDNESTTLMYTLTGSRHRINATTGLLTISLGSHRFLTEEVITVKIQDDGIPSLYTEVTVILKVLYLDCSQTQQRLYVDYDNVGRNAVGKIRCDKTYGSAHYIEYNQTEGIELHIGERDSLVRVTNGSLGTYSVLVRVHLQHDIFVTLNLTVTIGEILIARFSMSNVTWSSSLSDPNSGPFGNLKDKVEFEIRNELANGMADAAVDVITFRPGSVVTYFTLLAMEKAKLKNASDVIRAAVVNGLVGIIPVRNDSYRAFDQAGYAMLSPILYNNTDVGNTPGSTVNNTRVELKCEGLLLLPVGQVTMQWYMTDRHALIAPLNNSRFQNISYNPANRVYTSTLTIDPILSKDSGPFTCNLKDEGGHSASANLSIRVIAPPVLTLTPIRQAFINSTQSVILTCNVTKPRNIGTILTWYIGGVVNKTETATTSTLTVTGTSTPNTTYYCQGRNRAGDGGNSSVTTVYIVPPTIKRCPVDDIWPTTKGDEMAEALCPTGETGTMTRKCTLEGVWLPVNRSQCVSSDLQTVFDDIQFIAEGVQVSNLSTVAKDLSEKTEPETLETKEIELVLDYLEVILETAKSTNLTQDKNETKKLAKGFLDTISNPIDGKAIAKLNYTSQDNTSAPIKVFQLVDDLTDLVSERLSDGEDFTVEAPNIVLQVRKIDPNKTVDIIFPHGSGDLEDTNITSSVTLDAETIKSLADGQSVRYSAVFYKNITPVLPEDQTELTVNSTSSKKVNSGVWGINIFPPPNQNLEPPLQLNFTHANASLSDANPYCRYLNTDTNQWNSDGCRTTGGNENYTLCSCDHLTNFAILMRHSTIPPKPVELPLSIITIVGCSISIICLVLTIIIHIAMWKYVSSDQAIILMNICVCLAIAMLLFILGVNKRNTPDAACTAIAVALHLFYLLAFFMMLASGLESLWTIIAVFSTASKVKPLLIGAWVFPFVIVGVTMAVTQLEGYGTMFYCWLSTEKGLIWAFIGPVLLIILVNFIVIGKLIHVLLTVRSIQSQRTRAKIKKALRGMCFLIPVLGVSWIFGVFAVNEKLIAFQYIFAILNSLQGLFILITQCLLKKKIRLGFNTCRRKRELMKSYSRDLRSSAPRDGVSRRLGESESRTNLLQTQSISFEPSQQSSQLRAYPDRYVPDPQKISEASHPGRYAPDSPKNVTRFDVNRLGETQETLILDDPPPRSLPSGHSQPVRSHQSRGAHQETIPEDLNQSRSSSEDSDSMQEHRLIPEESHQRILSPGQGSNLPSHRPSGAYEKAIPEHPPRRLLSPEQVHSLTKHKASGSHQKVVREDPSKKDVSSGHGPGFSPREQGRDNEAYQEDASSKSSPRELFYDFTQETRDKQTGRDDASSRGVSPTDIKDLYADEWSSLAPDRELEDTESHIYPFTDGGITVWVPCNAGDTPDQNPQQGSKEENANRKLSLAENEIDMSPLYQLMQAQRGHRSRSPSLRGDNPSPPGSSHRSHDRSDEGQHSPSPVGTSRGQPHLEFLPFGIRADTGRISGPGANSPFLHSDMLGSTSHAGFDTRTDRPFIPPNTTPKLKHANA